MEPLKDQFYNPTFYKQLCAKTKACVPSLDEKMFLKAFDSYQELELMDRLKQVGHALQQFLPGPYLEQVALVKKLAPSFTGFTGMSFPYFVEAFGIDYFNESMEALHYLTRFSSSEFAVRPFLRKDLEKGFHYMNTWAKDENNHVRRLSSEGSRPLLPWSFKLTEVIDAPELTLPLLNQLQKEQDLYVKKSVGNHLNDLSKHHPQKVIDTLYTWDLEDKNSAWMAKKGVRTLIKNGFPAAFGIMGFEKDPNYVVCNFSISTTTIQLGESLSFSFDLVSQKDSQQYLNIDFQIYYLKQNGKHAGKVFKLKEVHLKENGAISVSKNHLFENFSTRKHYSGSHFVSLLINGVETEKLEFSVVS